MAYIQKRIGQDGTSFSYKVTIKHRSKFLKSKTFKMSAYDPKQTFKITSETSNN